MLSSFKVMSTERSSEEMVISAISLAIEAPVLTAIPASASERAGESFIPSPTIMTFRPASCSALINAALSSGRTSEKYLVTPVFEATDAAVLSLSPVIITIFSNPMFFSFFITDGASSLIGSSISMTADKTPPIAIYRCEYSFGRLSKRSFSVSGIVHPSSSKMK